MRAGEADQRDLSASAADKAGYAFSGSASGTAGFGVFSAQAFAKITSPFYTSGSPANAAAAYGAMLDLRTTTTATHAARTASFLDCQSNMDGILDMHRDLLRQRVRNEGPRYLMRLEA